MRVQSTRLCCQDYIGFSRRWFRTRGVDLVSSLRNVSLRQVSLEGGLDPPQRVLDPPRLSLARLLEVGVVVGSQEVNVGGGEAGDAAPKVGLQVPVRAVGVRDLLEGVDLAHDLCYAPRTSDGWTGQETETQRKQNSDDMRRIYRIPVFVQHHELRL